MEKHEHGKVRQAIFDDGYEYNETISNEMGEITEYFNICYYSDYSFMYANLARDSKVGKFSIEMDSVFYKAFLSLLEGLDELIITDDFSERFIEFKRCESGSIDVSIHLEPDEVDGTITVKNVMYDLRSKVDRDGLDTKERLNRFFSVLSNLIQQDNENEKKLNL